LRKRRKENLMHCRCNLQLVQTGIIQPPLLLLSNGSIVLLFSRNMRGKWALLQKYPREFRKSYERLKRQIEKLAEFMKK
jgi:hypothetical protein